MCTYMSDAWQHVLEFQRSGILPCNRAAERSLITGRAPPPSCNYGDIGCYTSANQRRVEGVKKLDRVKAWCIRNPIFSPYVSAYYSAGGWRKTSLRLFLSVLFRERLRGAFTVCPETCQCGEICLMFDQSGDLEVISAFTSCLTQMLQ